MHERWAVAANDALTTRVAGDHWALESAAEGLTAADNDPAAERLGELAMRTGRFIPRRPRR